MRKLSKIEWVAASIAVVFIAYMFFSGSIVSLFTNVNGNNMTNNQASVSAASTQSSSVQTQDVVVGTGPVIEKGMQVAVNYVLRLQDGTLIQDSKQVGGGQPFNFILGGGQLIPGWEMGVTGMRVGGKRVITIPPELGYGAAAQGPIPANSTLVFDIEVVSAGFPKQ